MMNNNEIENKICEKHGGSFFRIGYVTSPVLTANAKRDGNVIEKIVCKTVRTGVQHISNNTDNAKSANPTMHYAVKNRILEKNDMSKRYVVVSPFKNSNANVRWLVNGKVVSEDYVRNSGLVVNSYWNKKSTDFQMISFENIMFIN